MVNVPAAPNRGGWLRRTRTQPDGGRDAWPGDPGWGRPPKRREPWRPFLEGATGLGLLAFRAGAAVGRSTAARPVARPARTAESPRGPGPAPYPGVEDATAPRQAGRSGGP
ncbi:hypothetical protein GCM10010495_41270 [Kitasatospora herbaricolor]|nr:hypothetical protein GCM10010495_41270 [Kitasatospora herbaricolor]